jgi:hypothetical protein
VPYDPLHQSDLRPENVGRFKDEYLYMFTSGTSGPSKAAAMTQAQPRVENWPGVETDGKGNAWSATRSASGELPTTARAWPRIAAVDVRSASWESYRAVVAGGAAVRRGDVHGSGSGGPQSVPGKEKPRVRAD